MNWLFDERTECYSVQTTLTVGEYLDLVESAYQSKGSLSGQRDALKTTTGKRIRERMVSDIRRGAVLPPVVIGVVVDEKTFQKYPVADAILIEEILPEDVKGKLSIIDGMQRTTALMEAASVDIGVRDRAMRVEFWLTRSVRAMVYRMLVLNTGQVPWTLGRQLSVVYAPLLAEITDRVPELNRVFTPDKGGRRVTAGEFGSDAIVELYIAFNLRKVTVDTKESLSDEFSRLDFVENVSDDRFQGQFYSVMSVLVQLDKAFSKYDSGAPVRFGKGRNIFDGQPARIGLVVAIAQYVLGRPGADRQSGERATRMDEIVTNAGAMCTRVGKLNVEELGDFLRLEVLTETLDRRVGQVGRYERNMFFEAFNVLVSEGFEVPSMEPCWRAN
ncbi:hypothetical protein [Devosia psychrophila]|uniref:DGQHR domain-containing protein n=1 Tax=Devosia psychrophila TaxID=728005 RepID=A0A0F5PTG8_9HYPH|nr:hypothetical protein [Devosia psychrophila]KKC31079.1 hypothetical protein WH91_21700 [Devosia psychrophila]SFD14596.1 hypothetical protein SAMN04488059_12366 [Devosia psychrophila]